MFGLVLAPVVDGPANFTDFTKFNTRDFKI